jgi:hypothetical protein
MSVLPFPMSPDAVVWPHSSEPGGQVSAVGTLLQFPAVAGWEQRVEEGLVECQAQAQRAGRKATEAHGLLLGALTTIVAQSWDGPVSTDAVGRLIRAERLLARDAIPAIATSRQAAHELAGLMATRECEACDERQAGRGRAAAHGAAS